MRCRSPGCSTGRAALRCGRRSKPVMSIGRARGLSGSCACGPPSTVLCGSSVRILLTVPSLLREFGGPVEKAMALAGALADLDHEVVVAGADASTQPRTQGLGR